MTAGCPNRPPRGTLQARRQRPSPDTTLLGLYFQQPARSKQVALCDGPKGRAALTSGAPDKSLEFSLTCAPWGRSRKKIEARTSRPSFGIHRQSAIRAASISHAEKLKPFVVITII